MTTGNYLPIIQRFIQKDKSPGNVNFQFLTSNFQLIMRCPEFLAGHFVHFHNPYFDILHSRTGIAKFLIRILFHYDIQGLRLLVEIFFKADFTPADHALGAHPVTASDLRVLENEIMIRTERNADAWIPF